MSFTFVHTADWQIGKAFGALPKDVAIALTQARLDAIDRLAALAQKTGARHVLVAGDIFDSQTPAAKTVRQALARMEQHGSLVWHVISGNHDAHRPGGLWERVAADNPPANLRLHLTPAAAEIERGVWLLPAPLTGRAAAVDPTAQFDTVATPAGALRIGLAHGSVQGFGSTGEASVSVSPKRASSARLDYLALGDWHGVKQVDPRTWYSGTPEPDRFASNQPGHALVVRIESAGVTPVVETVPTRQFSWLRHEVEVRSAGDLEQLDPAIGKAGGRPSDALVQLVLTGRVGATDRQAILQRLQRLEASLRHLDADLSGLSTSASSSDLAPLGVGGELRQVGERLVALQSPLAAHALDLLLNIAADAGSDAK